MPILLTRKDLNVLALLGVIALGAVLWFGVRELNASFAVADQERQALTAAHAGTINDFLGGRIVILRTLGALLPVPPIAQPTRAGDFLSPAMALLPDAAAIGWIGRVEIGDLADVRRALTAAGVGAEDIEARMAVRADARVPRFIILDVLPRDGAQLILGTDIADDPARRAAMDRATRTREVAATTPAMLIRDPDTLGIVLYAPVYRQDHDIPAGFVAVGYRLGSLVRTSLAAHPPPPGIAISVSAGAPPDTRQVLVAAPAAPVEQTIVRRIDLAGETLTFRYVFETGAWTQALHQAARSTAVVLGGVLLVWTGGAIMLGTLRRLSEEETRLAQSERNLQVLLRELNHRLLNLLQVVSVLIRNTFAANRLAGDNDIQSELLGRLEALGTAIRIGARGSPSGLAEMVAREAATTGERLTYTGPPLVLSAKAAQMIGLLLHELTTNATKHGSLSTLSGRVHAEWRIDGESFVLTWAESGGPPARPPTRTGFGCSLIDRIVPAELAGEVTTDYGPDGLKLVLRAPLAQVAEGTAEGAAPSGWVPRPA